MKSYQEPIHYQNEHLCMKVWQFENKELKNSPHYLWHYHKEVELIAIQTGQLTMHTPDNIYTLNEGDVVMIGSSQLHFSHKAIDEYLSYIVLHVDLQPYFDPAMMMYYRHFSEAVRPLEDMNYIFNEHAEAKTEVFRIIDHIHTEVIRKKKGYEIAASMHIKHLLLTLLRYDSRELLQPFEYVDAAVMRPILEYVDHHLAEKVEMEIASKIAGMSYAYFSKFFKKCIGISFTEYVNRQRIRKAERLLMTNSESIADIAAAVGIENMAHFYELFKRFNSCTPKEYARKLSAH
ncbi:helix-turn-helix domain-containing protein [Paenibacillus sp. GCM10027626]|uniref:helix-turn-helix domain-containing protein n=1 Tax=Paenibacillus sp. GCM10027626 TaxID=3273411 RepID=UPI003644175E